MKNEIIDILKSKEAEMDRKISEAREEAARLLKEAEETYKVTKEKILAGIEAEGELLKRDEDEKLQSEFTSLQSKQETQKTKIQEVFQQKKDVAVSLVIDRILEEILDQENVQDQDHRA